MSALNTTKVYIYTDGACRGNPGPGGWGVLLRYKQHEKRLSGAETHTTNNRMELQAAIQALASLKNPCEVHITTDSTYVKDGITRWMTNWKKRGWRTSQGSPVKNQDLWQQLDHQSNRHRMHWHWVQGHSGHKENDIADQLARDAIDTLKKHDQNKG